jgi:hypothetical protein
MSSTLRFLGFGAAATGAFWACFACASLVVLPASTPEARKGLGEFIQGALCLAVIGTAAGSIGAAIKND